MGIYINPRDMSKEEWLLKFATETTKEYVQRFTFDGVDKVLLAHVDNGPFTAVLIIRDEREKHIMLHGEQGRPVRYYEGKWSQARKAI